MIGGGRCVVLTESFQGGLMSEWDVVLTSSFKVDALWKDSNSKGRGICSLSAVARSGCVKFVV